MWIAVHRWKGGRVYGNLVSQPEFRRDLRNGQAVDVEEGEIFDWMLAHPDGTSEGAYTDQVALEQQA